MQKTQFFIALKMSGFGSKKENLRKVLYFSVLISRKSAAESHHL